MNSFIILAELEKPWEPHCKLSLNTKTNFSTRETREKTADVIRSATALLTVLISILINAQKKSQMLFLINLCKWKQCFLDRIWRAKTDPRLNKSS